MTRSLSFLAATALLWGCGFTPDVAERDFDETASNWPGLLPQARLDALASGEAAPSAETDDELGALRFAAGELRARAARLSGPVLSDQDRGRLESASQATEFSAR